MGIVLPLAILFHPKAGKSIKGVVIAAISVVIGVLGERAAITIPGTAEVQQLYPGTIEGIWGATGIFHITFWETVLSLGIISLVALIFVIGLKYLELLPVSEPHPPPAAEVPPAQSGDAKTGETK
jgi:Ni/Fe-hydrogenase subunit HybB-like protein